jgi:hypothetical protein
LKTLILLSRIKTSGKTQKADNYVSTDYNYTDDKFLDGTNYGFRFDETNHEFRDSFGNVEEHTQLQGGSVRKNMLKRGDMGLQRANRKDLLVRMDTVQNSIITDRPQRANRKYMLVPMDTIQNLAIPNFNSQNSIITDADIYLNMDLDRPINRLRTINIENDFQLEQPWLEDELRYKSYHDKIQYGTVMRLIKEDEKKKWFKNFDKKKEVDHDDEKISHQDSIGSKPIPNQTYEEFNEKDMDQKFEIYFRDHQEEFDDLKQEIEEYFDIMCTHMKAFYGKNSLEIEGLETILRVVKIYSDDFIEFIIDDRWALLKNKIVKKQVFDEFQYLAKNGIEDMETFKKFKKGVLQNILHYYSEVKHEVDACVQAFTWLILVFPKNKHLPEKNCYLPHRACELKNSRRHYTVPNPKAVFLASLAFLLQIGVPAMIIVYHLFIHPKTFEPYVSGEDIDENYGQIMQQFCPSSVYELHSSTRPISEIIYKYSTKVIAWALLFLLNGQLKSGSAEECKQFRTNWSSHALPTTGLIWSRVQNLMSYHLIILTTIVLFFQDPSLQSLVLNCLAMVFLMKVDDELAKYHKVNNGIGTTNDNGRKILMSYIASGVRNSDKIEKFYEWKTTKYTIQFFLHLTLFAYIWTFTCV